jgi:glycosyltransferase involved in cell wall biosynthesis
MDILHENLHRLDDIKRMVQMKDTTYFHHTTVHPRTLTDKTISIVMTSHERSRQVYYTLQLINNSAIKDIQVILVDDSNNDPVRVEILAMYGFHIDFIQIRTDCKFWANPCVNYNIGFQYVQGGKVVIQNSEVCYIGDVLAYIAEKTPENQYDIFDVIATRGFEANGLLYQQTYLDTGIYRENLWIQWYQHHKLRNVQYHFLCAMSRNTFDRIGGFSYDYAFGSCYDDDDLLLKIKHKAIPIHAVPNEVHHVGGIHLFHGYKHNMTDTRAYSNPMNDILFDKKRRFLLMNQQYLELSDFETLKEKVQMYVLLNRF